MTVKELINTLRNNEECNFIGCCGSLLQINGINSSILYLRSQGIQLNGFVIIQASETLRKKDYENKYFIGDPGIRYIDGSILFTDLKSHERLLYLLEIIKILENSRNTKKLYIVADEFKFHWIKIVRNTLLNRKIIYCEIDDGILNYRNCYFDRLCNELNRVNENKFLVLILKFLLKNLGSSWIISFLKKNKYYIDCKAMYDDGNKIIPNYSITKYWMDSFKNNMRHVDYEKIKDMEGSILILGSHNDDDEYEASREFLGMIVEFAKQQGKEIFIKPHPRDRKSERFMELGCKLYEEKDISVEEILCCIEKKPLCLLGYNSAALLTGKVLFDVVTISYANIIENKNVGIRHCGRSFTDRFGDTVFCPKKLEDLKEILEGLIKYAK